MNDERSKFLIKEKVKRQYLKFENGFKVENAKIQWKITKIYEKVRQQLKKKLGKVKQFNEKLKKSRKYFIIGKFI